MSWVRLDDACFTHPKLLAAGPEAAWFWAATIGYCNRQKRRDGILPDAALQLVYPVKNPRRLADRLVELGLLERVQDGYAVHDYFEYQPAVDDDLRRARSEAGRRGGLRSGEARREAKPKQLASSDEASCFAGAEASSKQRSEAPSRPVPTRPDPESEIIARGIPKLDDPMPEWALEKLRTIAHSNLIEPDVLGPQNIWRAFVAKMVETVTPASEARFQKFATSWIVNWKERRTSENLRRAEREAEEDRRARQPVVGMSPAVVPAKPSGPPPTPEEIEAGMAAIASIGK